MPLILEINQSSLKGATFGKNLFLGKPFESLGKAQLRTGAEATVAVRRIAAPGRTILRVFRCVIANVRKWGLAATHPMFAISCMVHM